MNPEAIQAINKSSRGEELTQEEIDALVIELPGIVECIGNMAASAAAWLAEELPRWASIIADCVCEITEAQTAIDTCSNKRVTHLARYGSTRRIRKKNVRRALKMAARRAGL